MCCVQDNKGIPQVQRDLHQVEQLSRNLRAKTARLDAGAETIAATRLLAHEGLNTRKYALDGFLFGSQHAMNISKVVHSPVKMRMLQTQHAKGLSVLQAHTSPADL